MFITIGNTGIVHGFELELQINGLSPSTIKHYTSDAAKFLQYYSYMDVREIDASHIKEYLTQFKYRLSAKTIYEIQLGLRRFFRYLKQEGEITENPCEDIRLIKYKTAPQPIYSQDEIKALLASCQMDSQTGIRDYAMICVLFDTGVRTGELLSMAVPNWNSKLIKVDGKTGVRYVPVGSRTLQSLVRYMRRWDISEAPLWRGKYGPLTSSGVLQIIKRKCFKYDIPYKGVHAFRRASTAQMKRIGMNDSDIMEIMGWTDVTMLRRYVSKVSLELAQIAHGKFSPVDSCSKS